MCKLCGKYLSQDGDILLPVEGHKMHLWAYFRVDFVHSCIYIDHAVSAIKSDETNESAPELERRFRCGGHIWASSLDALSRLADGGGMQLDDDAWSVVMLWPSRSFLCHLFTQKPPISSSSMFSEDLVNSTTQFL